MHKPFTGNPNLFEYTETVPSAKLHIGVVGYPGDQKYRKEKGAQMYELFEDTTYDLTAHKLHMITYKISTAGGQSGAPVLAEDTTTHKLVAMARTATTRTTANR